MNKRSSGEVKKADQAWDTIASNLQNLGFLKNSKLRYEKLVSKDIDQVVFVSR